MDKLLKSVAYNALKKHQIYLEDETVASLTKDNPNRWQDFSLNKDYLLADFSHNVFDAKATDLMVKLFIAQGMDKKLGDYFELDNDFSYHFIYRSQREDKYKYNNKLVYAEVEKFHQAISKVEEKIENKEIEAIFFTDFVIIASDYNKKMISCVCESLKSYKKIGRNIHFASTVAELEKILQKVYVQNTFFVFADVDFKNINFFDMYDLLKKQQFHLSKQSAFVCQNIKFAQNFDEKNENIVSYSSACNEVFNYFPLMILPLQLYIGKDNLKDFLNGMRIADNDVKTDYCKSASVNLSYLYIWYLLLCNAELFNIICNRKIKLTRYINTLASELFYIKNNKSLNILFKQYSHEDKRYLINLIGKYNPNASDLIYFNDKDDEKFLSDLSLIEGTDCPVNVIAFKKNNIESLGTLFGIYEYLVLILKFLLDGNLKCSEFNFENSINLKNKNVSNFAEFLKDNK